MGTPAQQYVNFDAGDSSVEPPKVDATKVEEQPGAVETPAPVDHTTPEVRSPRVVAPGVLSDSPVAGAHEQSIIAGADVPQGYLGNVKHNLVRRNYVAHRSQDGTVYTSYAPEQGSNYPGAPINTDYFTEHAPFTSITLDGDVDPIMNNRFRIDQHGRAIATEHADPETTIDSTAYLNTLLKQQQEYAAWQQAGADPTKAPQAYTWDAMQHWDPEVRRAAFAYFGSGEFKAPVRYNWYEDNISTDPTVRERSRAQHLAYINTQIPENARKSVHPDSYDSGGFPHRFPKSVGLPKDEYSYLWWTNHRMREFDAHLRRAQAVYNAADPANMARSIPTFFGTKLPIQAPTTRAAAARMLLRSNATSYRGRDAVARAMADDSNFWKSRMLPTFNPDIRLPNNEFTRDLYTLATQQQEYATPDEFAYNVLLRGGKSYRIDPETAYTQEDYEAARRNGYNFAQKNTRWLGTGHKEPLRQYYASQHPEWSSDNPWTRADAFAYQDGVYNSGVDAFDTNTRWLGTALHYNQALMRGCLNALTFGTANPLVDDYFRAVTGTTVEQNANDAIRAHAKIDNSPWVVMGPGMGLEVLPQAALLLAKPDSAIGAANTVGNASRFTQLVRQIPTAVNTAYGTANGMKTFNTGTNSFIRQHAYLLDPNSPEARAMLISANSGDAGNALLPFTGGMSGAPLWVQGGAQAMAINAPQYAARLYNAATTDDEKLKDQLHIDNMADVLNFAGDTAVSLATGGKGSQLSLLRRIGYGTLGAGSTFFTPTLAYPIAKNTYTRSLDPTQTWLDRLVPHEAQYWTAKATGNTAWTDHLNKLQVYNSASQVAQDTEGYYDPQSQNYWLTSIYNTVCSGGGAEGEPIITQADIQNFVTGKLDPTNPQYKQIHNGLATVMQLQADTGFVPSGFFQSAAFQSLTAPTKKAILTKYIKSNALVHANLSNKDELTAASEANDIGFLFKGSVAQDPRFNDARLAVTQTINGMPLDHLLMLAADSGDSNASPEIQQLIMNAPAIKNFDISSVTPQTLTNLDKALANPAVKSAVMQMVDNLDFTKFMHTGADGSASLNMPVLNWIADKASADAEFGQVIQRKLNDMPIDQYIQMIGVASSVMTQQSDDASGDTGESQASKNLFNIFNTSVRTRLEAGNADSDRLAYALIPYMRQGMSQSSNGPHVEPATAKAFMTVLKRREFWQQFDQRNMLSFCEYLVSGNGSRAFGALPEEERTQWVADIKATCEPIIQQHMWNAFKEGDIETVRRFIALKHNFAKDPLMFYGASAAIILGGITVLGSLFSSGDDEDEDDEEADDDDAAYRKRIRKSLKQKEELNLDLNEDERD